MERERKDGQGWNPDNEPQLRAGLRKRILGKR